MNKNSLLKICDLTSEEIFHILENAAAFSSSQSDQQFPRKTLVASLFFEPSTRIYFSFASAKHQLGVCVESSTAQGSNVEKGESLYDTAKAFKNIGCDAVAIRHSQGEYFKGLEDIQIPILNAGDGCGDHPTQCPLDLLTVYQELRTFQEIKVAIIGDITYSRVTDNIKGALGMLGGEVAFSGPDKWAAEDAYYKRVDEAVQWADTVMMLRIQHERHKETMAMSRAEYLERYGLTKQRTAMMQSHTIITHPAPVNHGVEIDSDLVGAENSHIFKQIGNGVLVRKAAIRRTLGYEFE